MNEPKEITVRIKCEDDLVIKKKFLVYEDIYMSSDDETVKHCIAEAKGLYTGALESVKVTISLEVLN